jgi:hypothetical protein
VSMALMPLRWHISRATSLVWFVWDDGKLYLLPVKGSDTQWYKNVLKNPSIDCGALLVTTRRESTRKALFAVSHCTPFDGVTSAQKTWLLKMKGRGGSGGFGRRSLGALQSEMEAQLSGHRARAHIMCAAER